MARAPIALVPSVAVMMGACGPAATAAPVERPALEARARVAIAPVTVSVLGGAISLDAEGGIAHPRCAGTLDRDGTVRDADARVVLRLEDSGAIADGSGRTLFTLREGALVRADGRAIRLEGERATVEGSPDLELGVERDPAADDRTVLLLIAALARCER